MAAKPTVIITAILDIAEGSSFSNFDALGRYRPNTVDIAAMDANRRFVLSLGNLSP